MSCQLPHHCSRAMIHLHKMERERRCGRDGEKVSMSACKMSETLFLVQCAFLTCKLCTQSALINRSWPPVTACHVPPPTFYSRQGQDHHLEGQGHDQRILQRDIHYKCRANNTTTSTGRRSEGDGCGGVGVWGAGVRKRRL